MISILKAELFRLKKSKVFWAFLIVCAALPVVELILILGFFALLKWLFSGSMDESLWENLNIMTALDEIASVDKVSSAAAVLTLIATAIVLSKEFVHGTARNIILANKSREQVFFAFLLTAAIVGSCYLVTQFFVSALLFGAVFGFGEIGAGAVITSILCHFVLGICAMLFVITLVCMFLFTTRKQSLTIALPLLFVLFVPSTISTFGVIIVSTLMAMGKTVSETALQCVPFLNLNYLDAQHPAGLAMGMTVLYYLLFSALFFVIGFFSFRKSDLK